MLYFFFNLRTHVILASTDFELSAQEIFTAYSCRFQMEFLFRDAKQFAGLTHCQCRSENKLHFHHNAALAAINMAPFLQVFHNHKALSFPQLQSCFCKCLAKRSLAVFAPFSIFLVFYFKVSRKFVDKTASDRFAKHLQQHPALNKT